MKQARLDQLADGIFAIVMTILVFEIRIPEYIGILDDQILLKVLISTYPVFLSYLLSFSLLFMYWRSHHYIASVLAKNIDNRFSNYNASFFFFVGLVPFSAFLLGRYSYSKVAIIFFALNIIISGLILYRMRRYVVKSPTIENTPFTDIEHQHANMHILFPVVAAMLAILVSFYNPKFAIVFFTVAILFNFSTKSTSWLSKLSDFFRKEENKILKKI